eukprot:CAMPEP_0202892730 /NCGR_PEP_ID=MMETSP1392-20130828/2430_1 /ASSEMBLY_ACC=CAM_ASM_000868 /TAXON_ID=225041 /ORGANISM="Chlamydomonas chlamydogama, Strain SAG 11-48b" /LENGTH=199 /DNA_ID=CAMNT_0049576793 /DNA_START=160 /DNA_END=756 /DNA_ORIENTATION=+
MALPEGFNWFLILIVVVVSILVVLSNIYILVHYQHPEDAMQAWFPKVVIVTGLSIAVFLVLMYPLDVANKAACAQDVAVSSCTYTLPMYEMWLAMFIANLVIVWAILPFTVFFYEADSEFSMFQKIKSGIMWTLAMMAFIALVVGILYALIGYVVWDVQLLKSGTVPLSELDIFTSGYNGPCIPFPKPSQPPYPPPGPT